MDNKEAIGFCLAEVYCKDCGEKEYYNELKPFSVPTVCRKCGGELINERTEKFIKDIEELMKNKKFIKDKK